MKQKVYSLTVLGKVKKKMQLGEILLFEEYVMSFMNFLLFCSKMTITMIMICHNIFSGF